MGVIRVGGQLRVPRAALERLIGAPIKTPVAPGPAPVVLAADADSDRLTMVPDPAPARRAHPSAASGRRQLVSVDQLRFDA